MSHANSENGVALWVMKITGLTLFFTLLIVSVTAGWISPFDPLATVCEPFQKPDHTHFLGCNDLGQDLFSRLLHGTRVSLYTGLMVGVAVTMVAAFVALYSVHKGGLIDQLLMRSVDLFLALPFLPLVILLGIFFSDASHSRLWVLFIAMWPLPVRELRAQILVIKQSGFLQASRAMGAGLWHLSSWYVLPALWPLLLSQFIRVVHNAILLESSLALLGLGDPLQLSWGAMLYQANSRSAFLTDAWQWWVAPPGIAIAVTVASLAFIGFSFKPRESSNKLRQNNSMLILEDSEALKASDSSTISLNLESVSIGYEENASVIADLSLTLHRNEMAVLVGESGCGKSTLALFLTGLLPYGSWQKARCFQIADDVISGRVVQWQSLRGKCIAYIPQNAMAALNPVLNIERQLAYALNAHAQLGSKPRRQRTVELLEQVGLKKSHLRAFPHQLSGGMRQRVAIAIALCHRPQVLIADEPTSGQDVVLQRELLQLFKSLQRKYQLTILLITHDTTIAQKYADRVLVMDKGKLIFDAAPTVLQSDDKDSSVARLMAHQFSLTQERFWNRGDRTSDGTWLSLNGVNKSFRGLSCGGECIKAVSNASLSLYKGEVLGVVGSSGSGKSTLAQLMSGQLEIDSGTLAIQGRDWQAYSEDEKRHYRTRLVHMVYQDPYQSMNPRQCVYQVLCEVLLLHGRHVDKRELQDILEKVSLPSNDDFFEKRLSSLSGGQRQRLAFARAFLSGAEFLIADEPTSMLDQSIQKDILCTLDAIRCERKLTMLFITHDIALARNFCDRLVIMQEGEIVKEVRVENLQQAAENHYVARLLEAAS